ncbi:HdaA/DnaA family protein [Sphingomonas sp. GlSt437]|uniref:HdaA/DnaA family protein n=1 Tax=Sphingomonas sp. GlSt437 TaxID=3389970 RepID=UPI003A8A7FCD
MKQFALPLVLPDARADGEFIMSSSNEHAVQQLRRWATWPVMAALLTGPRKSGRSLLGRLFVEQSHGRVIDDAERQLEAELFHAWNAAQTSRRPLLIIADEPPPAWAVRLPDLRSRLNATPHLAIEPPDDFLRQALFERLFLRRGIDARPELILWLLARVDRSHLAIIRAVDALEQAAFEQRKRLSIPFARATLAAAELLPDRSSNAESP